jgi:hypothetical protein
VLLKFIALGRAGGRDWQIASHRSRIVTCRLIEKWKARAAFWRHKSPN